MTFAKWMAFIAQFVICIIPFAVAMEHERIGRWLRKVARRLCDGEH